MADRANQLPRRNAVAVAAAGAEWIGELQVGRVLLGQQVAAVPAVCAADVAAQLQQRLLGSVGPAQVLATTAVHHPQSPQLPAYHHNQQPVAVYVVIAVL